MNNIRQADADAEASSPFSRLPDEIILQILNKLMDLKSLCCFHLVSRRFSLIVFNVDTIAFTTPLINPHIGYVDDIGGILRTVFCALINEPFLLHLLSSKRDDELFPFLSSISFLSKFRGVKSLSIELPSSTHIGIDNGCLFKWKVKFGKRIESFYFLLQSSVSDETNEVHVNRNDDEQQQEEDIDMGFDNNFFNHNFENAILGMKDANAWHKMLLYFLRDLPMLEKVSITDSGRSGRLSLSGEKLKEVKEWVPIASKTVMNRVEHPYIMSNCYIPALKLPVSGYVMKGVYLLGMEMKGNHGDYDNSNDGFEGKEEAAFTEALMEILEKHKSRMVRLLNGEAVVVYDDSENIMSWITMAVTMNLLLPKDSVGPFWEPGIGTHKATINSKTRLLSKTIYIESLMCFCEYKLPRTTIMLKGTYWAVSGSSLYLPFLTPDAPVPIPTFTTIDR